MIFAVITMVLQDYVNPFKFFIGKFTLSVSILQSSTFFRLELPLGLRVPETTMGCYRPEQPQTMYGQRNQICSGMQTSSSLLTHRHFCPPPQESHRWQFPPCNRLLLDVESSRTHPCPVCRFCPDQLRQTYVWFGGFGLAIPGKL